MQKRETTVFPEQAPPFSVRQLANGKWWKGRFFQNSCFSFLLELIS